MIEYKTPYVAPTLVVDSVIFRLNNDQLEVLTVTRDSEPFQGVPMLPGGYNPAGETTRDALERIVQTKAGVSISALGYIEQLYTFDTVARDPRGHAVSVTYMGLGKDIVLKENEHTQHPQFLPVNDLPKLGFDHAEIIKYAHQRLAFKITYTNAVFALLPEKFTLTHLQRAYEAIFGRELDKRNFRKKYLDLELISATEEHFREGAHRPALLYRFNKQSLETLSRSFD